MTPRQRVLTALDGGTPDRIPCVLGFYPVELERLARARGELRHDPVLGPVWGITTGFLLPIRGAQPAAGEQAGEVLDQLIIAGGTIRRGIARFRLVFSFGHL